MFHDWRSSKLDKNNNIIFFPSLFLTKLQEVQVEASSKGFTK